MSTADGAASPGNVKALTVSIEPPLDAGEQAACGLAVLTDIHPGGTTPHAPVPTACPGGARTAADRALEFLLFGGLAPPPPPCASPPPPPPPLDGG